MSWNQVIVLGNLTRDIEARDVGEHTVYKGGIATNLKMGEREEVMFLDFDAWNRTGDVMASHLAKGDECILIGRLRTDQWESDDGQKRSAIKMTVDRMQFTNGRKGVLAKQDDEPGFKKPKRKKDAPSDHAPLTDDDVPF